VQGNGSCKAGRVIIISVWDCKLYTSRVEGGRKCGEREDMTGLRSSVDTPYDDVGWERRLLL